MGHAEGMESRHGLVTGATGYIGGLVVRRLLDEGWTVRVLARDASKLPQDWAADVDVVEGDATSGADLARAMDGMDVAWFLIHSMGDGPDFAAAEQRMAEEFGRAALDAGVGRIVYLGGLHPEGELSEHLASRVKVGEILMASGVPTAAVQAGVVLGEGSASYEMLRTLTERLPGAAGPAWLRNEIQPIDAADVVTYLTRAADLPAELNRTFDVGGPDRLSYADMMRRFAEVTGLGPRPVITAPVWTPGLAAHWIGLVTPVEAGLAGPLMASVLHDTVVKEHDLDSLVAGPEGGPIGFDESVRRASRGHDSWRFAKVLGLCAAAVGATATAGALATDPDSWWYRTRSKPAWQPPAWVFAPVWTALYADIAVISALHLTDALEDDDRGEVKSYSGALAGNLALNAGWCWAFFRSHRPRLATGVAAALAASSADLVRRVGRRRERGVVLSPYAAWTVFATALSAALARRNRH